MSIDTKLSKAQLPKVIQPDGFLGKAFGNMISNLDKKALLGLDVLLAKDILSELATKGTSPVLNKFERKTSG